MSQLTRHRGTDLLAPAESGRLQERPQQASDRAAYLSRVTRPGTSTAAPARTSCPGFAVSYLGANSSAQASAPAVADLVRGLPTAVPPAPALTHPVADEAYSVFGDREVLAEEVGRLLLRALAAEGVRVDPSAGDEPSVTSQALSGAETELVHRGAPACGRALRAALRTALDDLPVTRLRPGSRADVHPLRHRRDAGRGHGEEHVVTRRRHLGGRRLRREGAVAGGGDRQLDVAGVHVHGVGGGGRRHQHQSGHRGARGADGELALVAHLRRRRGDRRPRTGEQVRR